MILVLSEGRVSGGLAAFKVQGCRFKVVAVAGPELLARMGEKECMG
jgi:hypothetical protein